MFVVQSVSTGKIITLGYPTKADAQEVADSYSHMLHVKYVVVEISGTYYNYPND